VRSGLLIQQEQLARDEQKSGPSLADSAGTFAHAATLRREYKPGLRHRQLRSEMRREDVDREKKSRARFWAILRAYDGGDTDLRQQKKRR
jgi:hypothetical protein